MPAGRGRLPRAKIGGVSSPARPLAPFPSPMPGKAVRSPEELRSLPSPRPGNAIDAGMEKRPAAKASSAPAGVAERCARKPVPHAGRGRIGYSGRQADCACRAAIGACSGIRRPGVAFARSAWASRGADDAADPIRHASRGDGRRMRRRSGIPADPAGDGGTARQTVALLHHMRYRMACAGPRGRRKSVHGRAGSQLK